MAVDATQTKTEQSAVNESVDPKILKILGLEDVFDFDYDEYILLLKEKMVEGRMSNSSMSTEDVEIITNEYKRVKGKRGPFKIKKKTIKADKFLGKGTSEDKKEEINPSQKLLPGTSVSPEKKIKSVEDKQTEGESDLDKLLPVVVEIKKIAESILTSLNNQLDFRKKLSSLSAKESERSKRGDKEAQLESGSGKLGSSIVDKITKPFSSLFDRIQNFLLMTLLGSVANFLFGIFQNPKKLLQPIQSLMDGIFGFFNGILQWIDNNLINPIRGFVDLIESGLNAFIRTVNQVLKFIPGSPQMNEVDIPNIPDIPDLKAPDIVGKEDIDKSSKDKKQTQNPINVQLNSKGGSINPTIVVKKEGGPSTASKKNSNGITKTIFKDKIDKGFSESGGVVNSNTGMTISGLGQDTQLTALKKGEFVLVPGAAKALGVPFLEHLNEKFGGDNKERFANISNIKVKKAYAGGYVRPSSSPSKPKPTDSEKTSTKAAKAEKPGGGQSAVINAGKAILEQGFTVAEHPNFRKNNFTGKGPNRGVGYSAKGGERVGGHSSGSAHYKGLAIDVTDWRSGDWLGRTKQLANFMFNNKDKFKVTQIIHDPWGAWFSGEKRVGPAIGGHPTHLHLAFAAGPGGGGTIDVKGGGDGSGGAGGGAGGDESGEGGGEGGGSSINWDGFEKWMIRSDTGPSSSTSSSDSISLSSVSSSPSSSVSAKVTPSSITPKSQPSVPGPPVKQVAPTVLPLPGVSGKASSSGAMSGSVGTPPVDFSSDNVAEMAHRTAVKSQLNILEF